MRTLETRIPPPLVMMLLGAMAWTWAHYFPTLSFRLPFHTGMATAVAVAGLALNGLPKVAFGRAGTTVNPLRPGAATHLVTSGVYRYSRNPMYLGQAVILFGWGIYLHNVLGFLAIPAFVLYISRLQIVPEERHLLARFGDEYTRFCQQSPRWL